MNLIPYSRNARTVVSCEKTLFTWIFCTSLIPPWHSKCPPPPASSPYKKLPQTISKWQYKKEATFYIFKNLGHFLQLCWPFCHGGQVLQGRVLKQNLNIQFLIWYLTQVTAPPKLHNAFTVYLVFTVFRAQLPILLHFSFDATQNPSLKSYNFFFL